MPPPLWTSNVGASSSWASLNDRLLCNDPTHMFVDDRFRQYIDLVTNDHDSLFCMTFPQLQTIINDHGITESVTSIDHARLLLLHHLFSGHCLSSRTGVTRSACLHFCVCVPTANVLGIRVMFLHAVLCSALPLSALRLICVVLGMTDAEQHSAHNDRNFLEYIEYCHDNFRTCFDAALLIEQVDSLSFSAVLAHLRFHNIGLPDMDNTPISITEEILRSRLVQHLCEGVCTLNPTNGLQPTCTASSDCHTALIALLTQLQYRNLKKRPLYRLLKSLHVECCFDRSRGQLQTLLREHVHQLQCAKNAEHAARHLNMRDRNSIDGAASSGSATGSSTSSNSTTSSSSMSSNSAAQSRHRQLLREESEVIREASLADIRKSWPSLVSDELKQKLLDAFRHSTSSEVLKTYTCAVCAESLPSGDFCADAIPASDEHFLVLRKAYPRGDANPFEGHHLLDGLMLDKDGVMGFNTSEPTLRVCSSCYRALFERERLPKLALANGLYLGTVPDCLKDLTILEEAMIARRRARCCIVHLNGNRSDAPNEDAPSFGTPTPSSQRGFKGHVIVYPAHPENLGNILPPPMDDIVTPVCAIFVGSQRPSRQWLLTHAKPLVIRREKVRAALIWLKLNNPLYSDVSIDHCSLDTLPPVDVAPVHITLQHPTVSMAAVGARYDNAEVSCSGNQSSSPLSSSSLAHTSSLPLQTDSQSTPQADGDDTADTRESIFQRAVIVDIEGRNVSKHQMSAAAIQHLKSGGSYLEVPHESDPCNEYVDSDLFPLLYPSLFPYGLGGFEDTHRQVKLGMKLQAKHFFTLADRRFQTHYSFLFSVFNILQRRAVSLSAKLKVKQTSFPSFADQIQNLSQSAVCDICERLAQGQPLTANNDDEILVLRLMREVNFVNSNVQGTSAARVAMRNQIRGLMMDQGLPSFYLTINPADVYNPIVRVLAGEDIDIDHILPEQVTDYWQQAILVAKNPIVAARFFHTYITAFIECVLGFDRTRKSLDGGILGLVKAYYGCVEAQGRGTLHCHMIVWLEGALDMHEIRERVLVNGDLVFRDRLCEFLDDTIHTDIPPIPPDYVASERDNFQFASKHPCARRSPTQCNDDSEHDFYLRKQVDLHELVKQCQLHSHTATCYKYWKGGNDIKECRFDLDASHHVPSTSMDMESGELKYRVCDGLVNNFCQTILEAVRCNMDIKFIGSGASAKAILYYITDYITKAQLKTDLAFATLRAAVEKLSKCDNCDDPNTVTAKRMIVKCANALVSKQELSAQQVASYLLDNGDHYTSHKFKTLYWKSFDRYVPQVLSSTDASASGVNVSDPQINMHALTVHADGVRSHNTVPDENVDGDEDVVTVNRDEDGHIQPQASFAVDYIHRPDCMSHMCVWDFARMTVKTPQKRIATMVDADLNDNDDNDNDDSVVEQPEESDDSYDDYDGFVPFSGHELINDDRTTHTSELYVSNVLPVRGAPSPPKNLFKREHPQHASHHVRLCRSPNLFVPVPVGPAIPRRDRPDVAEQYCRLMLILFKPWTLSLELKSSNQSWCSAFEEFKPHAPAYILKIMDNMQRLHECRDSRDDHFTNRRLRVRGTDLNSADVIASQDSSHDELFDDDSAEELRALSHLQDIESAFSLRNVHDEAEIVSAVSSLARAGLFVNHPLPSSSPLSLEHQDHDEWLTVVEPTDQAQSHIELDERDLETVWKNEYDARRKKQKDSLMASNSESWETPTSTTTLSQINPLNHDVSQISIQSPPSDEQPDTFMHQDTFLDCSPIDPIERVINEYTLNREQALAFL